MSVPITRRSNAAPPTRTNAAAVDRVVAAKAKRLCAEGSLHGRGTSVWVFERLALFCTLKGRPLKASYVRTMLKRLADRAGVDKRVHPHGLRHTMAYELMMEGVPMPIIQQQLGHASLATTEQYLRHIAPKDVIKAMRNRSWRLDD